MPFAVLDFSSITADKKASKVTDRPTAFNSDRVACP